MRNGVKKVLFLLPAIVLAFVASFIVFIYEPITLYANNIEDFQFDFYTLIGPSLLFFFLSFFVIAIVLIIIAIILKHKKHLNIYYCLVSVLCVLVIIAYIHSNFLASSLPPLDGTSFDWSDPIANIVSVIICVTLITLLIYSFVKLKPLKTAKYCAYIISAIFIMLVVSLASTLMTTDALKSKGVISVSTVKNLDLVSNNKNFLIFLVDAVDSTNFNKAVSANQEYQKMLKDFSYFPDTLSGYAFTRDSIPFILSGEWNENQTQFPEYSTNAYNNSKFFAELSKQDYNRNLYDQELIWNSDESLKFDNIALLDNTRKSVFLKQEVKYFLYKALPFPLKRFSRIDTLDFSLAQTAQDYELYSWDDSNFYNSYLEQPLSKTDQNYFQFIHIEGAHVPFDLDANFNHLPKEDGTYEDKIEVTLKIINKYLTRLKENDTYNNSTIVILADHGYDNNGTNRANPILYIKGNSEKHDQTVVSKKQVSYVDLCSGFIELLNGKSSTEIFKDVPTSGRVRRFLNNGFNEEEHMEEFEQTGHAWETEKLKLTGRVFNL